MAHTALVFFRLADADPTADTVPAYYLATGGTKASLELDAERLVPLAGVTTAGSSPRGTTPRPVDAVVTVFI